MTTSEKHPAAATSLDLLSGGMRILSEAGPGTVLFTEMAARS